MLNIQVIKQSSALVLGIFVSSCAVQNTNNAPPTSAADISGNLRSFANTLGNHIAETPDRIAKTGSAISGPVYKGSWNGKYVTCQPGGMPVTESAGPWFARDKVVYQQNVTIGITPLPICDELIKTGQVRLVTPDVSGQTHAPANASSGAVPPGAYGAPGTQNTGAGCPKPMLFIPYTARYLCATDMNDGIGMGVWEIGKALVEFKSGQCADFHGDIIPIGNGERCITAFTSFRSDNTDPTPTYHVRGKASAGSPVDLDELDRRAQARSDKASAESDARWAKIRGDAKARHDAAQKCRGLVHAAALASAKGDNSKMEEFQKCLD